MHLPPPLSCLRLQKQIHRGICDAFPFQRHLADFWCINVSFRAKGTGGGELQASRGGQNDDLLPSAYLRVSTPEVRHLTHFVLRSDIRSMSSIRPIYVSVNAHLCKQGPLYCEYLKIYLSMDLQQSLNTRLGIIVCVCGLGGWRGGGGGGRVV